MEQWPNLFIVGAPKAGTSSLYKYLKKIPGIYMSPVKEPHYFSKKAVPENHYTNPIHDKKKYLKLFKNSHDEKFIGEASVWYLSDPDSYKLIYEAVPKAKILIMIRDPIERAFSHYLMFASRNFFKTSSFHEQIHHEIKCGVDLTKPHIRLRAGFYFEDIKKFIEKFGNKQVKLLIFEEFVHDAKKKLKEVLEFLSYDYDLSNFNLTIHNPYSEPKNKIINSILNISIVNKIRQKFIPESIQWYAKSKLFVPSIKPKMLEEDRNFLKTYYSEDVRKLEEFLKMKLPWSNFEGEKHSS